LIAESYLTLKVNADCLFLLIGLIGPANERTSDKPQNSLKKPFCNEAVSASSFVLAPTELAIRLEPNWLNALYSRRRDNG